MVISETDFDNYFIITIFALKVEVYFTIQLMEKDYRIPRAFHGYTN